MSLFEQYVKTNRKLPPELLQTLSGIDEPARLADTIAAHISVRLADKQRLLETLAVGDRLEMLVGLVDGEIDVQQMEKRIRGRVKSQMEKSQREYYLNEQMKAIQKELGEGEDGADFEDIDLAAKTALGHPMGPFELMDLVGIDVVHLIRLAEYEQTGDPAALPARSIKEKYEAGDFGRKTGRGWYEYPHG